MMTKTTLLLALAGSAAALTACSQTATDDRNSAVAANPSGDEQAIRALNARWLDLVRAKDAAGIAALYAEDGALMAPNMPMARGRAAVEKAWADMMAMPGFDLTFATEQLVVSQAGDMAMDRGTYSFAANAPNGPFRDTGKALVVWRKVDGEWKVAADIFNSDLPAAA